MNFFVGVTDNKWFDFLARIRPDEVNFWRPSSAARFRAVGIGAPFLFKLHSPLNYVVGGGFVVGHSVLPVSIAWEIFREKNGAASFTDFLILIQKHRRGNSQVDPDPPIGCIVLTSPFFFAEEDWIPQPTDWHSNVVQGRTYSTKEPIGEALWARVQERLAPLMALETTTEKDVLVAEEPARYGSEQVIRPRLGQGGFRILVTEAYDRRCSITGERTLPVLQAAHIKPYSESGPHRVSNGLFLRSDLHILFDRGLITVTGDHRVEVSQRIKQEYENGKEYYAFQGQKLMVVPSSAVERPSIEFLEYHNQSVFGG